MLTLKSPWADGTRHLLFEPLTLLEKLAALIPRPRTNLVVNPDPVAGEGAVSASQLDESSHPNELDDMTCAEARRRIAVRQSVRQMGGELKAFYLVMGQYDAVVISEAPDAKRRRGSRSPPRRAVTCIPRRFGPIRRRNTGRSLPPYRRR